MDAFPYLPRSPSQVGRGSTTPPPPFAKAPEKAPTRHQINLKTKLLFQSTHQINLKTELLLHLDRPFQDTHRGPGNGPRRLRWPAPSRQAPVLRLPVREGTRAAIDVAASKMAKTHQNDGAPQPKMSFSFLGIWFLECLGRGIAHLGLHFHFCQKSVLVTVSVELLKSTDSEEKIKTAGCTSYV